MHGMLVELRRNIESDVLAIELATAVELQRYRSLGGSLNVGAPIRQTSLDSCHGFRMAAATNLPKTRSGQGGFQQLAGPARRLHEGQANVVPADPKDGCRGLDRRGAGLDEQG